MPTVSDIFFILNLRSPIIWSHIFSMFFWVVDVEGRPCFCIFENLKSKPVRSCNSFSTELFLIFFMDFQNRLRGYIHFSVFKHRAGFPKRVNTSSTCLISILTRLWPNLTMSQYVGIYVIVSSCVFWSVK